MKSLGKIANIFDIAVSDGAQLTKIILAPFLIFSFATVIFTLASILTFLLTGQSMMSTQIFYGYMNMTYAGIGNEELRLFLAAFNWLSLAGILIFSGYSIIKYLSDISDRAAQRERLEKSKQFNSSLNSHSKSEDEQKTEEPTFKQAGNS